jgi:iron complex transport system substrate-binding protein
MVCQLGLGRNLVGVSHECDWPPYVQRLAKLTESRLKLAASSRQIDATVRRQLRTSTSLYTLDVPGLQMSQPGLIITQSLCGVCAVDDDAVQRAVSRLPASPQVLCLEPNCVADLFDSMRQIGAAADCEKRAEREIRTFQIRVQRVAERTAHIRPEARPRVVVLEWIDPPFSSGHWTPELVELAGGSEMIGIAGRPSRTIDWHEIAAAQPEVLIIACCGFTVARTLKDYSILPSQPGWNELPCVASQRVYVVDGSAYFNRPGPRLVEALEILAHTLHPDRHPLPAGLPAARRVA